MLLYIWLHRGPQYLYLSVHFLSITGHDARHRVHRLSSWRTEERKLRQCSIYRVFEMGNGNLEKFRADFGRDARQNSKNKAVPR